MIQENEHCRVWRGEDERQRGFSVGAHWGCPVMWLSIRDRMPPVDGRMAREGNGLVLSRLQALELAWVLEQWGKTGEMPEARPREEWKGWVEMLKGEPVAVAEPTEGRQTVVDGGLSEPELR